MQSRKAAGNKYEKFPLTGAFLKKPSLCNVYGFLVLIVACFVCILLLVFFPLKTWWPQLEFLVNIWHLKDLQKRSRWRRRRRGSFFRCLPNCEPWWEFWSVVSVHQPVKLVVLAPFSVLSEVPCPPGRPPGPRSPGSLCRRPAERGVKACAAFHGSRSSPDLAALSEQLLSMRTWTFVLPSIILSTLVHDSWLASCFCGFLLSQCHSGTALV